MHIYSWACKHGCNNGTHGANMLLLHQFAANSRSAASHQFAANHHQFAANHQFTAIRHGVRTSPPEARGRTQAPPWHTAPPTWGRGGSSRDGPQQPRQ
jgi:hypothetical protein